MSFNDLYTRALALATPYKPSRKITSGDVGAALITQSGQVYTGVSVASPCGLGVCAEHSAISAMLANRESIIHSIVAVDSDGEVFPPCGRCRQLMLFLHSDNKQSAVYIDRNKAISLDELMPFSKSA